MATRVVGYGRVSTEIQALRGTSQEDQEHRAQQYCKERGAEHEYKGFYGEARSGSSIRNRPALNKLIEDAKNGKFDKVVFTKLDRLARNTRELLNLWHLLHNELGLHLECLDDRTLNTDSSVGKVVLAVMGAFAEFERDLILERTVGGRRRKWISQQIDVGQAPYGYKWGNNKKWVIDNKKTLIYRRIVSMYLDQHYSMRDIANQLTREGIPTPSSGNKRNAARWNNTTISKILKSPAYTGRAIRNKAKYTLRQGGAHGQYMAASKEMKDENEWITITLPPLIEKARWDQIQLRIQQQKHKPKKSFKYHTDHFLLDNILQCGECGGKIIRRVEQKGKNGQPAFYYLCYWRGASKKDLEMNGRKRCVLPRIDADELDEQIFAQICDLMGDPDRFATQWLKDLDTEALEQKVNQLKKQLVEQKAKVKRALKMRTESWARPGSAARDLLDDQLAKDGETLNSIEETLRSASDEYDFAQNKIDRFKKFQERVGTVSTTAQFLAYLETQGLFSQHVWELPFPEKKRLLNAVISPETGGKCTVLCPTAYDFLDEEDLEQIPEKERGEKLTNLGVMFNLDFKVDCAKIETIIASVSKNELLNQFDQPTSPALSTVVVTHQPKALVVYLRSPLV